jgi:cytochrome c2
MACFRMMRVAVLAAALVAPAVASAAEKPPAGDAAVGAALFKQRCGICHTLEDGKVMPGPNLRGVVGRKAASVPAFNYSPALKASKLTWNTARLDQFLTAPQAMVPGTFMVISVPKPDERANVVAYLASLKR